jgi:hypothetical protein
MTKLSKEELAQLKNLLWKGYDYTVRTDEMISKVSNLLEAKVKDEAKAAANLATERRKAAAKAYTDMKMQQDKARLAVPKYVGGLRRPRTGPNACNTARRAEIQVGVQFTL